MTTIALVDNDLNPIPASLVGNAPDDYGRKLFDYEAMGIPEYWIVDFRALGARRFIGSPKQPTLSVYQLMDGEYQGQPFRGTTMMASNAFPQLSLSAETIFQAGSPSSPDPQP